MEDPPYQLEMVNRSINSVIEIIYLNLYRTGNVDSRDSSSRDNESMDATLKSKTV